MILETERLILRQWLDTDAEALFALASHSEIGPNAGWPPHESVDESLTTIQNIFSEDGTFAICLKEGTLVGSIALKSIEDSEDLELGYWIGKDYWGAGYAPEAATRLIDYAFDVLGVENIWAGYFEGNDKSWRVQKKLGFVYHHTEKDKYLPLIDKTVDEHYTVLKK